MHFKTFIKKFRSKFKGWFMAKHAKCTVTFWNYFASFGFAYFA